MSQIESFEYIANENAKVLILGTMPGRDSLKTGEYYAHRNNLFWDIMFRVCHPDWQCDELVSANYEAKKQLLIDNQIALWDVLKYCDREKSSLDRRIRNQIHNNFEDFFKTHSDIKSIYFNGQDASNFFEDFRPNAVIFADRDLFTLQSTSPSNKTNSFAILKQWMQIRSYLRE